MKIKFVKPQLKGAITSNRLTGKQMFLADKSLNISDLKLLNAPDAEEDVAPGNRVQIDHALFEVCAIIYYYFCNQGNIGQILRMIWISVTKTQATTNINPICQMTKDEKVYKVVNV
jgi:hypothetical protein